MKFKRNHKGLKTRIDLDYENSTAYVFIPPNNAFNKIKTHSHKNIDGYFFDYDIDGHLIGIELPSIKEIKNYDRCKEEIVEDSNV